jgi:hypothetical protein
MLAGEAEKLEIRRAGGWFTVRVVDWDAVRDLLSVTVTVTVNAPETVGVQTRFARFWLLQPVGSPT